MWLFTGIKNFFIGLFDKIKKLWNVAQPFLQEVLSKTASAGLSSLQALAIEAVQYVATQGLPTDTAKQDAFKAYMANKAKDQVSALKDYEINLLRETAFSIWKKANEK